MNKIRYILGLVLLFAFLIGKGQDKEQKDRSPKFDTTKSWGLGIVATSYYTNSIDLSFFYQKFRNEFALNIGSGVNNESYDFFYRYYPNIWRKRMDMAVETKAGWRRIHGTYERNYNQFFLGAGYHLRFKITKHLFLTQSGRAGIYYDTFFDRYQSNVPFQYKNNTFFELDLAILFNLGGFSWRKK